MLETLLLAAGAGARFGGGKLMARWGEGTVVSAAVATALAAPGRCVRLVVGCGAAQVTAEARRAAEAARAGDRLLVVTAPDWAEGMAASLRAGVAALSPEVDAAFVFLGDMPRIPSAPAFALARAFADGAAASCPVHGGRRGHPALIGRALFPDLLALTGDQGARRVLDRLGPALALVETDDPGVLQDVDTPEDLAALQRL